MQGVDKWPLRVQALARGLEMSQMARDSINRIRGLRCLDEEVLDKPGAHWWDPTKLLIRVDGIGMSGSEAERHLRQAGVQVELAGLNHILVLITIGDGPKEVDRLLQALRELGTARTHDGKKHLQPIPKTPSSGKMVLSPRQATLAPWREVVLGEARGKIAANSVTPYPPGIPLLVPGEEISDEVLST